MIIFWPVKCYKWILALTFASFCAGLMCIKDMEDSLLLASDMPFSVPSAAGHEVQLSSKHVRITPDNRTEYIRLALNYR